MGNHPIPNQKQTRGLRFRLHMISENNVQVLDRREVARAFKRTQFLSGAGEV